MLRRPNPFASSFAASASSCGISVSSISMIVTSEPKRWKIDANSQPMIPPPRTASLRGTSDCASRRVESTQRSLSSPSIGGLSGNEPVATIADLKVTSSPPSTAIVFASLKVPWPLTHSTPFALKSCATPPVICLTTPTFHSLALPKSSCGSPTLTPSFGNVSSASWIAKAVCTHAFVGMHPTRRHVPPSSGSFSMHATVAPSWAARIAAVYPPGPPPRTATSTSTRLMLVGRVVQGCEHRPAAAALADLSEAVALVEPERRVVRLDAERDLLEAVLLRLREQRCQQLLPIPSAAARGHDGDRQLGRPLVDEAVARLAFLEQAEPRRTDVAGLAVGDHRRVARPTPAHDIALDGALGRILRDALAPVERVVEHVAEEARVVAAAGTDHGAESRPVEPGPDGALVPCRAWHHPSRPTVLKSAGEIEVYGLTRPKTLWID